MQSLTLNAYAKVNFSLDIFSKREDGYHSLASVMQNISLHDTLTFTRLDSPGIQFTCRAEDESVVPCDASNIACKAVEAALAAAAVRGTRIDHGIRLDLLKRTPAQAGMGGGSSDAAAALRGADRLLGLALSPLELHAAAATLGSDVPFFLIGGAAAARGRGEQLTPVADIAPMHFVIVKPEENVSTGWAYGELDAEPNRASHRGTKRLLEAIEAGDIERMIAFQCNDFELPVFRRFKKIAWLHDELMMAGCLTAHLCGSGAAVYGIARDAQHAETVATLLRKAYSRAYTARSLTRAESLLEESAVE